MHVDTVIVRVGICATVRHDVCIPVTGRAATEESEMQQERLVHTSDGMCRVGATARVCHDVVRLSADGQRWFFMSEKIFGFYRHRAGSKG